MKHWKETLMKYRSIAILAGICVVLVVAIVLLMGRNPLYGSYKAEKLLYLSPLSSVSQTGYAESFDEITLSKKLFSIKSGEAVTEFEKPQVKTEEITEDFLKECRNAMWGEGAVSFDNATAVHYILNSEGKTTNHFLLETEDDMYLVKYYIVNEMMDIWHVLELKK